MLAASRYRKSALEVEVRYVIRVFLNFDLVLSDLNHLLAVGADLTYTKLSQSVGCNQPSDVARPTFFLYPGNKLRRESHSDLGSSIGIPLGVLSGPSSSAPCGFLS